MPDIRDSFGAGRSRVLRRPSDIRIELVKVTHKVDGSSEYPAASDGQMYFGQSSSLAAIRKALCKMPRHQRRAIPLVDEDGR